MSKISIPRASRPEDAGVSSRAIAAFLDDIEQNNVNVHSFMVIRHGLVAAECWRAPFTAERPHAMYSVSKTVTSTAIAIAEGEGLLSLSDRVRDFFPDYCEGIKDEYLDRLTLEDLISMKSGKNPSLLADKSKVNWVESYIKAPWYAAPGEEYRYINENMYMLCAVLTRVTGTSVREYLRPRLFEPLGIDMPFWETDAYGTESGGWGIYLKTEDLAKIMLCYANGGKFGDRQIIPADFVAAAGKVQSDNSKNGDLDARMGYGYGLWRCGGANAYRADGMFSQFGIVFEDYDAVLVVTSGISVEQDGRDFVWKHFPGAFIDESAPAEDTFVEGLSERLASATLVPPETAQRSPLESCIEGRTIKMRKKIFLNLIGFPLSVMPIPVTYMTTDKAGNIDNIVFNFGENECTFTWTEGDEGNSVVCGMDGHYRYGVIRLGQIDYKVCCNAVWLSGDSLRLDIRPLETIAKRRLDFRFKESGRVLMKPSSDPSIESLADFLGRSLRDNFKNPKIKDLVTAATKILPPVLEPMHKGKIE